MPFEEAPFGVTGLETAFAALYTYLVEPGLLPLETLLERMSAGPARAYGLEPPRIAVGAPANLVLLDANAMWQVTERGFRSRSVNSWLLGKTLKGRCARRSPTDGWCTKGERRLDLARCTGAGSTGHRPSAHYGGFAGRPEPRCAFGDAFRGCQERR